MAAFYEYHHIFGQPSLAYFSTQLFCSARAVLTRSLLSFYFSTHSIFLLQSFLLLRVFRVFRVFALRGSALRVCPAAKPPGLCLRPIKIASVSLSVRCPFREAANANSEPIELRMVLNEGEDRKTLLRRGGPFFLSFFLYSPPGGMQVRMGQKPQGRRDQSLGCTARS